jgi:hypothetical protein
VRRAGGALTAALAALVLVPATADAHALVQRDPLPIPQWLFAWAAAAVLVISFFALAVLWPQPRLERDVWRPIPGGRFIASAPVQTACAAIGVFLLLVTIVAGYVSDGLGAESWAAMFIFNTFWVGLVFASILFGDLFRAFSPWRALGRLLPSLNRPYPERWGRWPAAIGLFCFTWLELVSDWASTHPGRLVTAAVLYTCGTLAFQYVYGVETWQRRGEAFAVYFNLFSRLSIFETRDGVVGVRPPLAGLPKLDRAPGTVALVTVMIGTVTFDGLSQGPLWQNLSADIVDALDGVFSVITSAKIADTLGLCLGVAIVGGFYRLGIEGARSVGGDLSVKRLERGFIHSLVPIAAVYVAAHYFSFLIFDGQTLNYLASDPFGQGWDLFGTVTSGIDYSIFPLKDVWYVQVAFVVVGHVAALTLAHDRALTLYGDTRLAVRSQYWMLGIMVGFTSLALWLLAQAGT